MEMKTRFSHRSVSRFALATIVLATAGTAPAQGSDGVFTMSPTRSRLVILLHGVTSETWQAPEEGIDSTVHPRWYWGEDFIKGLMGVPTQSQMHIVQTDRSGHYAHFVDAKGDWHQERERTRSEDRLQFSQLAPIVIPKPSGIWLTGVPIWNKTAILSTLKQVTAPSANPSTSVMVSFRPGATHLMPQTGRAIDQIYHTYQNAYGSLPLANQPQIYLIGHSFGGIVARTIMTNPTGKDLFGNKLTAQQRIEADFIRNRTVWVNTLSSPHLGTHVGDISGDVSKFVRETKASWDAWFGQDTDGPDLFNLGIREAIENKMNSMFGTILKGVAGERECLADLTRMSEYNSGILKPALAKRTDGSLVPIYTACGRSAGSKWMDRDMSYNYYKPHTIVDVLGGSDRHANGAGALHAVASLVYRKGYGKEGRRPYGTALLAEGDRVRSPYMGIGPANARAYSTPLNLTGGNVWDVLNDTLWAGAYVFGQSDGEYDNDGFVGFDSGHGLGLQGSYWYRLYPRNLYGAQMPWDIDHHGSMMFNIGTGMWLHNELLKGAGPYGTGNPRVSTWPGLPATPAPSNRIRVIVESVYDVGGELDWTSGADFSIYGQVGDQNFTYFCPDNKRYYEPKTTFAITNFASSIVPIRLSVVERDNPPTDPHDPCAITPAPDRDNLYVYFDTRTGRVYGDVEGAAGQSLTSEPYWKVGNRVRLKFRVEQY